MKKIIFLILAAVCFFTPGAAETEKELFDTGVLSFKQGQYQQAVDNFSRLIEISPGHADAYKNRGVSYMKQEKYDLAIQDFEKARELFPELRGLYSNLGVAFYYKKEYEKAISSYNTEIEMAPDNPVAFFNRALCLAEVNRKADALADLSRTLELQPDFYWALCYKADLLVQTGDPITAKALYEDAIAKDPDTPYAREKLAKLNAGTQPAAAPPSSETVRQAAADPDPDPDAVYALQAGAFKNASNAENLKARLVRNGFDARILVLKDSKDTPWYLVRTGSYASQKEAERFMAAIREKLDVKTVVRPHDTW